VEGLWRDLASDEAGKAYRAVALLGAAPGVAVPLLKDRLHSPKELRQADGWVTDLDGDQFAVRSRAADGLRKLGVWAEPVLRKALEGTPSAQARKELEGLVGKLTGPTDSAEVLRLVRAVEVLEHAGTPEARAVLEGLAGAVPGGRLEKEANAALRRLRR
jgi:hypothetical protein